MSLKKRIKLITAVNRLAYQENKPISLMNKKKIDSLK